LGPAEAWEVSSRTVADNNATNFSTVFSSMRGIQANCGMGL
jgi:hypothetical protein